MEALQFNTVADLEQYLEKYTDLCMLLSHWESVTKQEAEILFSKELETNKDASKEENLADAKQHYLDEINQFLQTDFVPTSMTFLGYRRRPNAWAIADALKEFIKGEPNESKKIQDE